MIALVCIPLIICSTLLSFDVSYTEKKLDKNKHQISINFILKPGEYLYKESLTSSVDSPYVKLTPWTSSEKAVPFFDKLSNRQREGYTKNVTLTSLLEKDEHDVPQAIVHTHFLVSTSKEPQELHIPISFAVTEKPTAPSETAHAPSLTTQESPPSNIPCNVPQPSLLGSFTQKLFNYVSTTVVQLKNSLTSLFTSTGSRAIRFASAFLLGILLSLTPCIYPMIPITVGVLQASGSSSAFKNFLLALSYTVGISTTFALLGFIAAIGSCVFGELQGSPFIVIPLALLLLYFGLAMLDIIHLYIPKFLMPKASKVKGGSFLSAYIFGAVSGTVASPCLSPGLILILNYVTTMSSGSFMGYLEGFLLLFIFGVGSSLPLLIIGTFSGSLKLLPKAGMWMVEIKKLVGIMLIAMAFYHLSHLERLLPWYVLVWVVVLSFFILGIYYFASIDTHEKKWMRRYKNCMGTALIVIACIFAVQGERAIYDHMHPAQQSPWLHDYEEARAKALAEHKPLFIDIGATYCSACKVLDKQIFAQEAIQAALKSYVALKIDSDVHTAAYEKVKSLYGIYISGFPTYLIVNPATGAVLKKWSVEIDQLSIDGLIQELKNLAKLNPEAEKPMHNQA
jgi:thiol:disulfide interchange protein